MARLRLEIDREAVRRAALASPEVRAAVTQIAEQTAASARSKLVPTDDAEVVVHNGGQRRARSYLRLLAAQGEQIEADRRVLGSSLPGGAQ